MADDSSRPICKIAIFGLEAKTVCPHYQQPIAALILIVNINEKTDSERLVEVVGECNMLTIIRSSVPVRSRLCVARTQCEYGIITRFNFRLVRWPYIFVNEFTAVCGNPVLNQLCRLSRRTVFL